LSNFPVNCHVIRTAMGRSLSFAKKHAAGLITCLLYLVILTFWIKVIPMLGAPDEQIHLEANALFIADNNRLPVSGVDDLRFLTNCRVNPLGAMPCTNSYNTFPQLNYLISAVSIKLNRLLGLVSDATAARLPQIVYAIIFFTSLHFSVVSVGLGSSKALMIALSVCLIPQVIFIFSYLNQDAFALTSASLVLLSCTLALDRGRRHGTLPTSAVLFLGISLGLLLSSKYNYFALLPAIFIYLAYILRSTIPERRGQWLAIIKIFVIAGLIAGPWYLRNLVLYGDLLGGKFLIETMSKFHPLGTARTMNPSNIEFLVDNGWFYTNFRSFFAVFGFMSLFLGSFWYLIAALLVTIAIGGALFLAGGSQHSKGPVFIALGTTVLIIAMSAYHSLAIDFQAQGRYLFPILFGFIPAITILMIEFPRRVVAFVAIWDLFLLAMLIRSSVLICSTYCV
jgi:hypothetical protein